MKKINISPSAISQSLIINLDENRFEISDNHSVCRFFKGVIDNKSDFEKQVIEPILGLDGKMGYETKKFCDIILKLFDIAEPYNFEDAFKLKEDQFRIMVFSTIDIGDMINSLGAERIATDGKTSIQKKFDPNGNYIDTIEMSNIYEVYEVNGSKLNIEGNVYALKCWCTTTNNEHWLWIDEQYKDKPLEAVASTFRIHENLIPHIKELKRQGDVLFVEMKSGTENIKPEGNIAPLTAEQYFGLLSAQS
jgi:hypothetical protein